MTAKEIFKKTMPFNIARLVLGLITVGASLLLLIITVGLGALIFKEAGLVWGICLWIAGSAIIKYVIMHYFGYLVKAGHVAVIAEAVTSGQIPENQVEYGKNLVKEKFVSTNAFFAVDRLISGAVSQIQSGLTKVGNALDFIPGMSNLTAILNLFVKISLDYVDECCMGYAFFKKDQGTFKSACDGVVIYAENWKALMKNAAKTTLKVILITLLGALVIFIPVCGLFRLLNWSVFIGFIISVMIAMVCKFAFMDSFVMIEMMSAYMAIAPEATVNFDLYDKFCKISRKFKELFNKAKEEGPIAQ